MGLLGARRIPRRACDEKSGSLTRASRQSPRTKAHVIASLLRLFALGFRVRAAPRAQAAEAVRAAPAESEALAELEAVALADSALEDEVVAEPTRRPTAPDAQWQSR